jgi:PKD repeat protein
LQLNITPSTLAVVKQKSILMTTRTILSLISVLLLFSCNKKEDTPVTANFSYSGTGVASATVQFTNSSANASSYSWDFGDNTTSTLASPSHTYTKGGVYTVKLTATGSSGSNSVTKTVNISSPSSAKITGVKITQMPFTDASGAGWDSNSGPEVYFSISDANDNVLLTGQTFSNILTTSLPLTWSFSTPLQVSNFASTYKIRIYDEDVNDLPPSPDDYIGGYQFALSAFTATGYPTTATLYLNGSSLKIDLALTWQ